MKIKEIMTPNPEVLTLETTIQQAAQKMKSMDVGVFPIGDGDRLVGIITDRDIVTRAVADDMDPSTTTVQSVMSDGVIFCYVDQSTREAAQLMQEHQVRRLPIIERDTNRLVGIVSLGDLAVESGNDNLSGETLEEVSRPARPVR